MINFTLSLNSSNRIILLVSILLLVSSPTTGQTIEDENNLLVGAEFDVVSRYIWRGLEISDKPALQPSIWVANNNYSLLLWTNVPLGPESGIPIDEATLYFNSSFDWETFSLQPSVAWYNYPQQSNSPSTVEIELSLFVPLQNFSLSLTESFDVSAYLGSIYSRFGVGWMKPFKFGIFESALAISAASEKFNHVNTNVDQSGFHCASLDFSLNRFINEHVWIRPHLHFNHLLDKNLKNAVEQPFTWVFGISITYDYY